MQQLSGINVLVYYAPHTLTTNVGMKYEPALQVGAGLAVTYWVFSFVGIYYIDKIGRRPPLTWGALVCAICFLCVSYTTDQPFNMSTTDGANLHRPACFRKI